MLNNFALDGLEEKVLRSGDFYVKCISGRLIIHYKNVGCAVFVKQKSLKFRIIRYAHDFIVFGISRRILEVIKSEVIYFIQQRGLLIAQAFPSILNFQKEPFNFLSYTFKYRKC